MARKGNPNWVKGGKSPNPRGRAAKQDRADGWGNILTGLSSTTRDKRVAGSVFELEVVSDIEAQELWRGDDIAARAIEMIPGEALREDFHLQLGDKDLNEEMDALLDDLQVRAKLLTALEYERAYGGAALYPVINDGAGSLELPLNEDRISEVKHFILFEPRELTPDRYYTSITDPKFGEPETYRLNPINPGGFARETSQIIHESRLIIFPGIRVTRQATSVALSGWGDSILNRMARVLRDFDTSWSSAAVLLTDFAQGVFKMDGLAEAIMQNKDGLIKKRLLTMDLVRSVLRSVVIDSKDDFERKQTPMSGLPEILDRMANRMAAAANMPVTLLMGQSPSGLNATGASDIRFFYDFVGRYQEKSVRRPLERMIQLILLSRSGPTKGKEPEYWCVEFKPLWQPSEKELADARYLQAQADNLYITTGVLSPEEVAVSRFGGDAYSTETVVDFAARERQEAPVESPVPGVYQAAEMAQSAQTEQVKAQAQTAQTNGAVTPRRP